MTKYANTWNKEILLYPKVQMCTLQLEHLENPNRMNTQSQSHYVQFITKQFILFHKLCV
jgi:hypothetical protein